jgi:hypothetical protein
MEQRIGSCSICGGDVVGWYGIWMSVIPPPPPKCTRCGAETADDVIQMAPMPMLKTKEERDESIG